jgi:hypothetical protein
MGLLSILNMYLGLFSYYFTILFQNDASCTNFYKLFFVSELNLHETYPQF